MSEFLSGSLKLCALVLDRFDPYQPTTLTEFVSDFLKQETKTFLAEQRDFIISVCEGCLKQSTVLDGIIQPFCRNAKKTILRRDRRLFEVLAYFLLFLRKSYSTATIQAVLCKLYTFSIRRFLLFFSGLPCDVGKTQSGSQQAGPKTASPMHSVVKNNWYASFDRAYVDAQFYGPYCEYEAELRGIVSAVESAQKTEPVQRTHRTTLLQPFNFTTPQRKTASEARLLSRQTPSTDSTPMSPVFFAKAIPLTTYEPSEKTIHLQVTAKERRDKIRIFKTRIDQRELVRRRLQLTSNEPRRRVVKKRTRLLAEVREREMDGMQSPKLTAVVKTRKTVTAQTPRLPVKQTAAALLREKALFQKHKESKQKKTEELAAGCWDPEEYEKRFRKLEEKDLEAAIVENERKIIDAMQSLEKAITAKRLYDEEAKLKAVSERELQKGFREQRRIEMEEEIRNLRGAVEQAQMVSKVQLGEAKRRALQRKQEQALLVKEENNELHHRYLDQCEEEMLRRKAIIAQIQDMEARIGTYERTFDFGAAREYGNLTDLSLADLQDRLIALRFEMMDNLSQKRERILDEKELFKQSLEEAKVFVETERPQWDQEKRAHAEKALRLKELRDGAHCLPNVTAVRNVILQQSRERRKQRVVQRESLLCIRDSAWDRYFYA